MGAFFRAFRVGNLPGTCRKRPDKKIGSSDASFVMAENLDGCCLGSERSLGFTQSSYPAFRPSDEDYKTLIFFRLSLFLLLQARTGTAAKVGQDFGKSKSGLNIDFRQMTNS